MKVEIRLVNLDKDYEKFCGWWSEREHFVIPREMLSQFGFIGSIDGKDIAAAWLMPLLTTNTGMLRFPIADPESTSEERNLALDQVILTIHDFARDLNIKYMLCSTNHDNFIKRLKNLNYIQDSKECVHMMGVL